MRILGLSFDYHDAAAALVIDGEIIAAAEEERFSRKKHDAHFPKQAIDFCLKKANLRPTDLDAVVFYERPLLKFERLMVGALRHFPKGIGFLRDAVEGWFRGDKFDVRPRIVSHLGIDKEKIFLVPHHISHASAAFFCSPFEEATIVTLDGVGEWDTAMVSLGRKGTIKTLKTHAYPHSIGLLYSTLTAFLGFEVNEGEYKVMGMSGFGEPRHVDKISHLIKVKGGRFSLDLSYFNFFTPSESFATEKLFELLGTPREPESPFDIGDKNHAVDPHSIEAKSRHYADIAASLQKVTENVILEVVQEAVQTTGIKNLVMAGGVALNSLANGRIIRELGLPLYIHPAAGDAGGALGAALYHQASTEGKPPRPLTTGYLGEEYDDAAIKKALTRAGIRRYEHIAEDEDFFTHVADLLRQGKVIGWFQGRFEWGPRALGARSILGNPCFPEMQRTINEKIKFREPFRPFAPAILAERATEFFDMPLPLEKTAPEYFMLGVHSVRPEKRSVIPAVTHVDGTARVQLLAPDMPGKFRKLVEAFDRLTSVPVLLNTSFNRRGEPMVASPEDALRTFSWSGLDILVMSQFIIRKD